MTRHPTLSGANTVKPIEEPSHEQTPEAGRQTPDIGYGDYRIRTDDPLLAKQMLYQLS